MEESGGSSPSSSTVKKIGGPADMYGVPTQGVEVMSNSNPTPTPTPPPVLNPDGYKDFAVPVVNIPPEQLADIFGQVSPGDRKYEQ